MAVDSAQPAWGAADAAPVMSLHGALDEVALRNVLEEDEGDLARSSCQEPPRLTR